MDLELQAKKEQLKTYLVHDAGRTQVSCQCCLVNEILVPNYMPNHRTCLTVCIMLYFHNLKSTAGLCCSIYEFLDKNIDCAPDTF